MYSNAGLARHDEINKPFTWLGIFGHPDDETSASGGTMVKWSQRGGEVYVITATGGEEGTLGTGGMVVERDNLAKVRELELRKNLELYGVNPPFMLRYKDQDLDKEDPEILSLKILDIIHMVKPDLIITFGPSGISSHPDHIAIHKASVLAFEAYVLGVCESTTPILIYPSIPSDVAAEYGLKLSDDEKRTDIVVDIEETIDIKIQGLKNYRSQEDAQEFAARLSERPDPTETFAVGPATTLGWESSEVISYLRSL